MYYIDTYIVFNIMMYVTRDNYNGQDLGGGQRDKVEIETGGIQLICQYGF